MISNPTGMDYYVNQNDYEKAREAALAKLGWKPGHQGEGYCDDEVDHSPAQVVDHKS